MPKLIYIKTTEHRDDRLHELIDRIRSDDTAAYLPFETPERARGADRRRPRDPPRRALRRDAAARDDAERRHPRIVARAPRIPVPYTATIGREDDLTRVRDLLARDETRVAQPDRTRRDRQEPARDRDRAARGRPLPGRHVLRRCSRACSSPDCWCRRSRTPSASATTAKPRSKSASRTRSPGAACSSCSTTSSRSSNAAPVLVRLSAAAPLAKFLVTSRIVLRIRGEQVYDVAALPTPDATASPSLDRALRSSACMLFVDRAQRGQAGLHHHRRERRRHRRHLPAPGGTAARDRARRREGAPAQSARHRGAPRAEPAAADGRRARPAGAAPHDARDDRLERGPAPRRPARPARRPRRLRDPVHPRGGRSGRRRPVVGRHRAREPRRPRRRLARQAEPRSTDGPSSRCSRSCASTRSGD